MRKKSFDIFDEESLSDTDGKEKSGEDDLDGKVLETLEKRIEREVGVSKDDIDETGKRYIRKISDYVTDRVVSDESSGVVRQSFHVVYTKLLYDIYEEFM